MANANYIWRLIAIAVFYLAVALAFLSWVGTGFSAFPDVYVVLQHPHTLMFLL